MKKRLPEGFYASEEPFFCVTIISASSLAAPVIFRMLGFRSMIVQTSALHISRISCTTSESVELKSFAPCSLMQVRSTSSDACHWIVAVCVFLKVHKNAFPHRMGCSISVFCCSISRIFTTRSFFGVISGIFFSFDI